MQRIPEDFLEQISALIERRTGLSTYGRSRSRLIDFLKKRPEVQHNATDYLHRLSTLPDQHPLWQALLAELTIGETYFMRDEAQINALQDTILPAIIQDKRKRARYSLRIWSAGCASGEEVYTLAMLVHKNLPDRSHWHIDILGTDINEAALEVAREGIYREWSFRGTPALIRDLYFQKLNTTPPAFQVRPEIQAMVHFTHANLINQRHFKYPFDLILCRNVLIYFTAPQIKILEENLHHALHASGWLMPGPAETLQHIRTHYILHHIDGTIIYQKKTNATPSTSTAQKTILPEERPPVKVEPVSPPDTNTDDTTESIYQKAVQALHNNELDIAIHLARQYIDIPDYSAAFYSLLGSVAASQGEYDTALDYLTAALKADMLYADAHYLMALVQMENDNYKAARTSVRSAIYCRPDFALAHLLSGDIFEHEGNHNRAIRAWETARRFARDIPAHISLSDVATITADQLITLVNTRINEQDQN